MEGFLQMRFPKRMLMIGKFKWCDEIIGLLFSIMLYLFKGMSDLYPILIIFEWPNEIKNQADAAH